MSPVPFFSSGPYALSSVPSVVFRARFDSQCVCRLGRSGSSAFESPPHRSEEMQIARGLCGSATLTFTQGLSVNLARTRTNVMLAKRKGQVVQFASL